LNVRLNVRSHDLLSIRVRSLAARARSDALRRVSDRLRRELLPSLSPGLMQFGQYWPHEHASECYSRPIAPDRSGPDAGSPFAVPPRELWAHYCTSAESFLASGREDCEMMSSLLARSGAPIEHAERILELGCAGGRMLRWLTHLAPQTQLWGLDIWSSAILWCQEHLSPPCYFATNTTVPHLPFEDRSFDLVYCGSVFTHLDDLAETWFLELHRILRPGARLYFSVNDLHAVRVFDGDADEDAYPRYHERTGGKHNWDVFVAACAQRPDYQRFRNGEAYMLAMGRSISAHVMWDSEVLARRLDYGFRTCSITPEAYGHQTAVLLERV
jgi:SAM-dependent methyltransferase